MVFISAFLLLYNSARPTLFHRARHFAPSSLLSEMPDPERNPDDKVEGTLAVHVLSTGWLENLRVCYRRLHYRAMTVSCWFVGILRFYKDASKSSQVSMP